MGTFISLDNTLIIAVDDISYVAKEITDNNKRKKDNLGANLPKAFYSLSIYMKHSPNIVQWYRTKEERDEVFDIVKKELQFK